MQKCIDLKRLIVRVKTAIKMHKIMLESAVKSKAVKDGPKESKSRCGTVRNFQTVQTCVTHTQLPTRINCDFPFSTRK